MKKILLAAVFSIITSVSVSAGSINGDETFLTEVLWSARDTNISFIEGKISDREYILDNIVPLVDKLEEYKETSECTDVKNSLVEMLKTMTVLIAEDVNYAVGIRNYLAKFSVVKCIVPKDAEGN